MRRCCEHVHKDVGNMLIALCLFVVFLKKRGRQTRLKPGHVSRPVLSRTAVCFELQSGRHALHEASISFVGQKKILLPGAVWTVFSFFLFLILSLMFVVVLTIEL